MQIRIADVGRMNCKGRGKNEEESIIYVSSPLLFCVGPKYIQKNKQRKQPYERCHGLPNRHLSWLEN